MFINEGNSRFSFKVRFLLKGSLVLLASECPGLAKFFVYYQIKSIYFILSFIWPSGKFMTREMITLKASRELESADEDIQTSQSFMRPSPQKQARIF